MGHFNIKKKDAVLYQAWHPYFIAFLNCCNRSALFQETAIT